jgi:hypothetical protein
MASPIIDIYDNDILARDRFTPALEKKNKGQKITKK